MLHRIQSVAARQNYMIEAVFFGGAIKQFDVKQLFSVFPPFQKLQTERALFEEVRVDAGGYGISWNDELDLDAETIWEDGILVESLHETDINHLLAYRLSVARNMAHMTQKALSEKTGIYQGDISKIERGIGNPSLQTLKRLADGMDMDLYIDFTAKK